MDPNKIDLEKPLEFYEKLRGRKNLTKREVTQLIKFVDEVKYVIDFGKLGPQGRKAAVSVFNKLSTLENKHRTKQAVKINTGLFQNV